MTSDRQNGFSKGSLCGISISPLNEALIQQPLSDLGLMYVESEGGAR